MIAATKSKLLQLKVSSNASWFELGRRLDLLAASLSCFAYGIHHDEAAYATIVGEAMSRVEETQK